MGTLFVHRRGQQSYSSLKCLVAASICEKSLKLVEFDDSDEDFIMKFQPLEKAAETNREDLTDPLAITWYLASNEAIFGGGEEHQAQILQWDFFAQSEIRPYLHGYIKSHVMNRRVVKIYSYYQNENM